MKKIKSTLTWFALMSKRLYKKASFLLILALIPTLVIGYGVIADDDSGIVTVALAKEADDELTDLVFADLQQDSELVRYIVCDSPEGAEALLVSGKADSAWIFPSDLSGRIEAFAKSGSARNAFIRVIEREENVLLLLARERLSATLFTYTAESLYLDFTRENSGTLASLSDKELLTYYDEVNVTDTLFSFDELNEGQDSEADGSSNYLLSPVRGLLAVVTVLCGLATAMYFIKDKEAGAFAWIPERRLPLTELCYQLVSVLNLSLVSAISLALSGTTASLLKELAALLLYALCTAVFCMMLRRLCGDLHLLGMLLPLLTVAMLAICPIFFDLGALRELQYLFPPTYYINAVYNGKYFLYMGFYTLAVCLVYFLTGKLFKRA